jgi:iron complex transport system substrate-binding protein
MRIVSLLPSATEILFALGFDREVLGVSHECDFPAQARDKRVVVHSRIPHGLTSEEIDKVVREYVSRGESLYSVDAAALRELAPDMIVTQDLCHVCSASPDDLAAVLADFEPRPQVLSLNPQNLQDVWRDIALVGKGTFRVNEAQQVIDEITASLAALSQTVEKIPARPRVAFLEWLDPFYVGGHWVPEMIALAAGEDVFGKVATPSFRVTARDIIAVAPDIIVVSPCGYSAEQGRAEYCSMKFSDEWNSIPAVRSGRVYAFEANSYASRPGPRLAIGVEALAKIFHPAIAVSNEAASGFTPISTKSAVSANASASAF